MLEFYSQDRGFMSLQSFVMFFGTPVYKLCYAE